MVEEGYYKHTEGTYFQADYYLLITNSAMFQKNFQWLEKFLIEFKPKLQPELREAAFNFGMARLEFEKKDFEKSLKHLTRINLEYFDYIFHIKILYLKIFFEIDYLQEVLSLVSSIKKYLYTSKKVTAINKIRIKKLINLISDLVKIKEASTMFGLSDIKNKIESDDVWDKFWLLEKISELELKKRVKS